MERANCKDDKEANLCWCPTVGTTVWGWTGEGGRNCQKQERVKQTRDKTHDAPSREKSKEIAKMVGEDT